MNRSLADLGRPGTKGGKGNWGWLLGGFGFYYKCSDRSAKSFKQKMLSMFLFFLLLKVTLASIRRMHLGRTSMESRTSLVAQRVKNLLAKKETGVRYLGWEDPLDKGMAIHSSILAWRTVWTAEPGELQSMGSQRVGHD